MLTLETMTMISFAQAMHSNMELIRQSPQLLRVLLEIEGTGS